MKGTTSAYLSGDERVRLAVFNSITDRHTVMGVESSHSFLFDSLQHVCSSVTHIVSSFPPSIRPLSFRHSKHNLKKTRKNKNKRKAGRMRCPPQRSSSWLSEGLSTAAQRRRHTRTLHTHSDWSTETQPHWKPGDGVKEWWTGSVLLD